MATKKVYLDAGHGGSDPGAVDGKGNDSIYTEEEDLNLSYSLELRSALKRCGIDVKMSRTTDKYPTLAERAREANAYNANIFVSWHFNSGPKAARGIEVLYCKGSWKGKNLATKVYDYLDNVSPWEDRGTKARDNLYVLNHTKMPAIIVEGGFISNSTEEKMVHNDAYQTAMVEAACKGICAYLGVGYRPRVPVVVPKPTPTGKYYWVLAHTSEAEVPTYKALAAKNKDTIVFKETKQESVKNISAEAAKIT